MVGLRAQQWMTDDWQISVALESCGGVCIVDFNEHIVLMDSEDELTILL